MGYGNHSIPDTVFAKLFTSFYLLLGISLITLVGSAIFAYVQWKGNQARLSRDRLYIARRGMELAKRSFLKRTDSENKRLLNFIGNIAKDKKYTDSVIYVWKKSKDFFRHTTIGFFFYESLLLVTFVTIGAVTVGRIEEWPTVDSFYFAIVTMTTVG